VIFEDPLRKRWRHALIFFFALSATALGTLGLVLAGWIVDPPLPQPFLRRSLISATEAKEKIDKYVKPVYTNEQLQRKKRVREHERTRREKMVRKSKTGAMPLPDDVVVAFTIGDDPPAIESLEKHITQIDVVIPTWFELPGATCQLVDRADDPTRRVLSRAGVIVLPRLANVLGYQWQGEASSAFLRNDQERSCLIKKLVDRLVHLHAEGVNIDLEELRPEDSEPFLEFLVELRAALHAKQLRLTVDVILYDPAYDLEYISSVADAVMVMAYDEHFSTSAPGPVASRDWLADTLVEVKERLPLDRTVVVLGAYGYDWKTDPKDRPGYGIAIREAMDMAHASGATPIFEEDLENTHFAYKDAGGGIHEVWFQDALAIWNQLRTIKMNGFKRVGLWRLGTEDETIWNFFDSANPADRNIDLTSLPPGRSVEFYGDGEVLTVRGEPQSGVRSTVVDPFGWIEYGTYLRVPTSFLVERRGNLGKQLVLTFDDGPSAKWTPAILDTLKALNVPAVFFVTGEGALNLPHIIEREAQEGHLVGNHTFSHPHMENLTVREAEIELNTTQRVIEGLTGSRTPLFRAPFTANIDPKTLAFPTLRAGLEAGYLVVGANIDSKDWTHPGEAAIADKVIEEVTKSLGQIILFHDGGGDRAQTVDAIRSIVPRLRAAGYEFVSLDRYLGLPRSELEKTIPFGEQLFSFGNKVVAYLRSWGWMLLASLFLVCTLLAIARILFLGFLTVRDLRREEPKPPKDFDPLVTVLIPAFNEEKVIAETVQSILRSDHRHIEVVVIDDGSKDRTALIVGGISQEDPRVRLVRQGNEGKAAAANHGLRVARGEIVVAVDADTLVPSNSIPKLVRHFADPKTTAVCGNVEVGNVNSLLTTFQAIEYVTSQNFDRRAFSALNCISVVPGALGAWRRDAVLASGGYSHDTLTEDADLTLTILRAGGRVVYEPEATGRTEAPETLSALLRQRFRWTFGTYQCLWKHKTAFFHGSLGKIGLPNMVLFQIIFPTLSPIGDIVMLLSIFRGDWSAFLSGYLAFLAMDVCGSLLAFTLDKKPMRWLLLLLIQRFTYRQLMYYVSIKAMIAAIRGRKHGWRKLDRTGSVSPNPMPDSSPPTD
jgi:peptidoglycan-N-acetylglucosamine deacetylase